MADDKSTCLGKTKTGEDCKMPAVKGGWFCRWHSEQGEKPKTKPMAKAVAKVEYKGDDPDYGVWATPCTTPAIETGFEGIAQTCHDALSRNVMKASVAVQWLKVWLDAVKLHREELAKDGGTGDITLTMHIHEPPPITLPPIIEAKIAELPDGNYSKISSGSNGTNGKGSN